MKNTKRGGCAQCTASSFTYTTENCLRQPSLKGETAVGENTAVPGEYGIFIPLLFSAHGVLYTVFCDM